MSWMELSGAILSILGVWLTTRRHILCWPVGLVSVLVYCWVFVQANLYSDALLQLVFAAFLVYGWLRWRQHLNDDGRVRIARLPRRQAIRHCLIGASAALALGAGMHFGTDAALPWLDATLAAFSLVAQFWQGRRHIAAWWLWIAVDVVYIGEYMYKALLITSVLYAVFIALAVMGLREWQRATITTTQTGRN